METLLTETRVLTPSDDKTNLIIPFELKKQCAFLKIVFEYVPKTLDDREQSKNLIESTLRKDTNFSSEEISQKWENYLPVTNLLTLSLRQNGEFVGALHRGDCRQRHYVSKNYSSNGFLPFDIVPGTHELVVSCHSVVTKECTFSLEVLAGDDEHELESI